MGWEFFSRAAVRLGIRSIVLVAVALVAGAALFAAGSVRAQTTLDQALDVDGVIQRLLKSKKCVAPQAADQLSHTAFQLVRKLDYGLTPTQGRSPIAERLEKDAYVLLARKCPPPGCLGGGFFYIPGTNTCIQIGSGVGGATSEEPNGPSNVQEVHGDLQIGLGITNFNGHGSFASFDDITTDRDQRNQSYSRTGGVFGLLGTWYNGIPIKVFSTPARPFIRSGIMVDFSGGGTSLFLTLGDNVAEGTTKVSQNFSIPIFAGLQFPLGNSAAIQDARRQGFAELVPEVATFEIFGGGMWDHRKASFTLSEIATPIMTSGSKTQMQLNPAVGVGARLLPITWNGVPVQIGTSVIVDFQRPIKFTVQSEPFPSAFYTLNTGHQVNTTILFTATFPTAFGTQVRRP